jgi:hypothetical protein
MAKYITDADLNMQITADGLEEQIKLLEKMPAEMNKEFVSAVRKGNALMKKNMVPRVKRFSGSTANSIRSSLKVRGVGVVTGITGPDRKRAHIFRFMQDGRSPGARMPWIYDLVEWVEKKWGLSGDESKLAAYRLARSIHLNGIDGTPIAQPVLDEKNGAAVELLRKAADKVVEKLRVK